MLDILKLTPWLKDTDAYQTSIHDAFHDMKSDGFGRVMIYMNLSAISRTEAKRIAERLCKTAYHASRKHIDAVYCFQMTDLAWRNVYIIPKNTDGFCQLMSEFTDHAFEYSSFDEYKCFMKREDYLIGLDSEQYAEKVGHLNRLGADFSGTVLYETQKDVKETAEKELADLYDFFIVNDDLFTAEHIKELKEIVLFCVKNNIPLLEPISAFHYGNFVGKESLKMLMAHILIPGVQEYIYTQSYDIILKKVLYTELYKSLKKLTE